MDMGAAWERSAQGLFHPLEPRRVEFEDERRSDVLRHLRHRLGDAMMVDAVSRAVGIMGEVGVDTMSTAQRVRTASWFYSGAGLCESPLEVLMLAALMSAAWTWTGSMVVRLPGYDVGQVFVGRTGSEACIIEPQAPIEPYRVDFRVGLIVTETASGRVGGIPRREKVREMVVECDGHAFHDRTDRQAGRDRARDRAIQQHLHGGLLFRYSGSEIWKDPCRCGAEAIQALWRRVLQALEEQ